MKKSQLLIVVLIVAASTISMHGGFYSGLLDEQDYELQRDLSRGPALSAPLDGKSPYWESFNLWQCFPTEGIVIQCLEAEYSGVRRVPTLDLVQDSHQYEFSMDPEPEPDCDKVISRWKDLLKDQKEFCAYGAFLQDLDTFNDGADSGSLWILNQIKTVNGYWHFEASDNYLVEP